MTKAEKQILAETHDATIRIEQKLDDHIEMGKENKKNGITRWEAMGQWAGVALALALHAVKGHK